MLVEINLLPKKEPRNTSLLLLMGILAFIVLIGIGVTIWLGQGYKGKIETITQQQNVIQELIAAEQAKMMDAESLNSVEELNKAVNWAQDYPIKTVPILRKLTALLPERGFIQTLSYEETGSIVVLVQFDTSREASYYLKNLLDSYWVEEAMILKLATIDLTEKNSNQAEEKKLDLDEQQILPRYFAEYEVMLNRSVLKKEAFNEGGEES
ncbi:fimbrial protein [Bacillus sp. DTU_2020_1000418_1_SI_GHA_SEK_038]|uniref:fimbrial protein n=1 Tax=Bacillus sp. DTU_2020_1000418_1_SI_GHA_SEK_038 TaxID=3077585 RepID=UPI0028E288F3|nr:fimbrial protein [Bacillus sp. DTU_2020_1000418_1_SI_GHA_SEK_038]WNS74462.1 fimbrial protein [Bacillus sp. DTU_2020_1000418_1_SI_GHA_SEK_038]